MIGMEHSSILLESGEWIEPSSDVVLTFDRIILKGTVRYCNQKRNNYRVSVDVGDKERRTTPRFPMDEPGTLIALGDSGIASFPCRLTDFSRSGLGLNLQREIAAGTMICVETGAIMVAGSVRRCVPDVDGSFRVGVAVTDVLPAHKTRGTSVVARIRRRLAELISGRAIESAQWRRK